MSLPPFRLSLPALLLSLLAPALAASDSPPPAEPAPVLSIAGRDARLDSRRLREAAGRVHAVVAFRGIPGDAERAALGRVGVLLHHYLPEDAFLATVPAGRAAALLALPFVRGAEPLRPEWRCSAALAADLARDAPLPGAPRTVHCRFFPDTPLAAALEALARAGATALDPSFGRDSRLTASLPCSALPALLREEEVRWVEVVSAQPRAWNEQCASFSRVDVAQTAPLGLTGEGVHVAIMDEYSVDATHGDFGGRVTEVTDYGWAYWDATGNAHATNVAGTILGDGAGKAAARGMAPGALGYTFPFYRWYALDAKVTAFGDYAIEIDNNSWSGWNGWEASLPDVGLSWWTWVSGSPGFGDYSAEIGDLDGLAADTGVLVNFSSGNQADDDGNWLVDAYGEYPLAHYHYNLSTGRIDFPKYDRHMVDGDGGCISPPATGKNGLVVGSVDERGNLSPFSGHGPVSDGRVKPDLVAVGENVLSTFPGDLHGTVSGTSSACAVVSGIAALVIEAWERNHASGPRLDVLRGLLLHTARDAGRPGPDYDFGWGVADAGAAAALALGETGRGTAFHRTGSAAAGATREFLLKVTDGRLPLRVTLAWTDSPGNPAAAKAIVDDLDLTLVSPSGETLLPFRLDPAKPAADAVAGVNSVDTTEQVLVAAPATGVWKALVKGTKVTRGPREFALWFSHPFDNRAPVAVVRPDPAVVHAASPLGAVVALDGSLSTDANGNDDIAAFAWDTDGDGDFADEGGSGSGVSLSAPFPVGDSAVTLRVTDALGLEGTRQVLVRVLDDPPVAELGAALAFDATDPGGRVVEFDASLCSDPQGAADLAEYEWDLDGDAVFGDASGPTASARLPVGETVVGLRVRDRSGLEGTDTVSVTIRDAEHRMDRGGSFRGALDPKSERDTFFLEALAGSTLDLSLKTRLSLRAILRSPSGGIPLDGTSAEGGRGLARKGIPLPETGWYWLQVEAGLPAAKGPYSFTARLRVPKAAGREEGVLDAGSPEATWTTELLAGSTLSVRAKGSRKQGPAGPASPSLEVRAPDGTVLGTAGPGRGIRIGPVPATGTYAIRVFAAGGEPDLGGYGILWKGTARMKGVRLRE